MEIYINESGNEKVAVVKKAAVVSNTQDALDLLADIFYLHGARCIVLPKSLLAEEFFDLKTGLAGEILQKFSTYRTRLAIVGDFSKYESGSLADFIRESNGRGQVVFVPTEEEALRRLRES